MQQYWHHATKQSVLANVGRSSRLDRQDVTELAVHQPGNKLAAGKRMRRRMHDPEEPAPERGAKRSMPETSEDDNKRGEGAKGRGTHSRINANGLRPSEMSCYFEHIGHVIGGQGHSEIPPFWRIGRCAASCHLSPLISHPEPRDQQILAQLRAELGSYSV